MPNPVQVATKRVAEPVIGENGYTGFHPGKTEVLKAGARPFGGKALTSDIQIDHDVEIRVRDGARLYIDVYRPAASQEKVPAVLSWSFYGKKYSAMDMLPICVWNCCVPNSDLSGLEKFEGLDPADWCPKGYAIISIDTRGAGNSDGQICVMGSQDAEDGYDVVEAVAKMNWCNGNVDMAGNSALAIAQWFIAAQRPPSLKTIAPWEGMGDMYREQFCRGGWFSMSNFDLIAKAIVRGQPNSGLEDYDAIKKWIRWGSKQEWYELYSEKNSLVELGKFFDRYLREEQNDWETSTPKVRWSALQFGDRKAIDDIVLEDFPAPSTEYQNFFLDASSGKLVKVRPSGEASISYDSEDYKSFAEFSYTFEKARRLIGLPKAVVYMSCDALDDFTVFAILRKKDSNGKLLMHLNFPFSTTPVRSIDDIPEKEQATLNLHMGPIGILRASQRAIDESRSIHPNFPFHPHRKLDKIKPGTIVKLEIGIWAMGVDFNAGETISLRASPSPQPFVPPQVD
ncbi:uncharacterized protein A1O9_11665 [Exophiala aquamarina CBS 119918]|uniref:Xaa-Pro dipeptidyl-peptidase C-terminal domain-containing protein n=1 Tax=Exophiala aquamarina CBS 119918 TaxID=1182545 RepID=A0A072NX38_9EURO|nr:uncharacterized protein A1O9_11665 [Exophiala aquamarina CBS 119918]KEF52424.1 hypothetical protein A1O9_11665 [Exophiala aquamarina CBS 119918]